MGGVVLWVLCVKTIYIYRCAGTSVFILMGGVFVRVFGFGGPARGALEDAHSHFLLQCVAPIRMPYLPVSTTYRTLGRGRGDVGGRGGGDGEGAPPARVRLGGASFAFCADFIFIFILFYFYCVCVGGLPRCCLLFLLLVCCFFLGVVSRPGW